MRMRFVGAGQKQGNVVILALVIACVVPWTLVAQQADREESAAAAPPSREVKSVSKSNEQEADEIAASDREVVESLFDSMRRGTYVSRSFPKLTRRDIPALLRVADSEKVLETFPRNPISSQYEPNCREGIVAVWLIEGIRKGNTYPSLNALCLPKGRVSKDWNRVSETNHKRLVAAYRKWWSDVRDLSAETAARMNPLDGTNLHWH